MISRRKIRIDVLLTIYEHVQQHEQIETSAALQSLHEKFKQTGALLNAIWHLTVAIADYAIINANQKASKLLPTEADLHVSTRIAQNPIILDLKSNNKFSSAVKLHKSHLLFENEYIRQLFMIFSETSAYQEYIQAPTASMLEHKAIVNTLIQEIVIGNDISSSFLAENFINYDGDIDFIAAWTTLILDNPKSFSFNKLISGEKLIFADDLIKTYIDKKSTVFEIIEPKLVNWDAERVAILDLIILHLGIIEILYFPTIPLKVTINEYIDLAKGYSTPQSGQFVNGLLDNVRKELEAQGKIFKLQYFTKK